jgi:hypothetical protein
VTSKVGVNVYSGADTQKYWNAMQALRQRVPLAAGVPGTVRSCSWDSSGSDDLYLQWCPPAWLEFAVNPTAANAQLCFPREYYAWCLQYLNQALINEPPADASAEARVVWTLDVWAHVSYALFALNLNWSALAGGYVDTRFTRNRLLLAGLESSDISAQAERRTAKGLVLEFAQLGDSQRPGLLNAKRDAIAAAWRTGGNSITLNGYSAMPVQLPAFATLPIFWVGSVYARNSSRSANRLWSILLAAVQPWSSTWSSNWLPSRYDAADVAAYAADGPLSMAAMQWRLFAARDYAQAMVEGQSGREVLLSEYIASVGAARDSINFEDRAAVPGQRWSAEIVRAYASKLLTLDYNTVLSNAVADHVALERPRVMPNGAPMTVAQEYASRGEVYIQGEYAVKPSDLTYQYVTSADLKSLWKGEKAEMTARMQAAVRSAATMDCGDGQLCASANEGVAKGVAYVKKIPVYGQIVSGMMEFGSFLVGIVGAAVGAVYFPFRPLTSPVARTLTAPGWSFAPTGSTTDIWLRWGVAAANYERLLPGLFTSVKVPMTVPVTGARNDRASGTCITHPVRGGDSYCTICVDKLLPPCAALLPEFADAYRAQTVVKGPPLAAAREAASGDVVDYCNQLAVQWALENPQYGDCITVADLPMWQQICRAVNLKQLTVEAGISMWAQYVANVKGCGIRLPPPKMPPPSTPRRTATRSFVDAVIIPFNPLRLFGG